MNNSLQMMVAALMALWFGLGYGGTVNASSMVQSVFSRTGMGNPVGDNVPSKNGINNIIVFDNFSILNLDHSVIVMIASDFGENTKLTHFELDSAMVIDNVLVTYGNLPNLNNPGSNRFDPEKMSLLPIPEPGKYVMVLIGLGLIGFTLRRRTIRIPRHLFS